MRAGGAHNDRVARVRLIEGYGLEGIDAEILADAVDGGDETRADDHAEHDAGVVAA